MKMYSERRINGRTYYPAAGGEVFKKLKDKKLEALFNNAIKKITVKYRTDPATNHATAVIVIMAGTRENFYKDLQRYWG